ncbi:hypothetical protein GWN42_09315 [candidate division KSB1 bacterium]|nr:hypothetical protein [candidate division KSB1 bacterium]
MDYLKGLRIAKNQTVFTILNFECFDIMADRKLFNVVVIARRFLPKQSPAMPNEEIASLRSARNDIKNQVFDQQFLDLAQEAKV